MEFLLTLIVQLVSWDFFSENAYDYVYVWINININFF